MIGWQTIVVILIILLACAYVSRLAWGHIRAFGKGSDDSSCATGCGNCANSQAAATPQRQIIQLSRSKSPTRR